MIEEVKKIDKLLDNFKAGIVKIAPNDSYSYGIIKTYTRDQICRLFSKPKPAQAMIHGSSIDWSGVKPDEGRLLPDEAIKTIVRAAQNYVAVKYECVYQGAKAQLAKDLEYEQARMERLKGEIETHLSEGREYDWGDMMGIVQYLEISKEDWQAFWDKYLRKREGVE